MVDEVGGIDYKDGQELSLGATNYNLKLNTGKQDNKTEILCMPSHDVNRHVLRFQMRRLIKGRWSIET